jgi:hypothetical protein
MSTLPPAASVQALAAIPAPVTFQKKYYVCFHKKVPSARAASATRLVA